MYKTTLLNLGIPKSLPHTPGSVQVHQDKDLFKGLRDAYWSDDEVSFERGFVWLGRLLTVSSGGQRLSALLGGNGHL